MGWLRRIFAGLPTEEKLDVELDMKELHVNPPEHIRAKRNRARLVRLKAKLQETKKGTSRYKALKREIKWRTHLAKSLETKGGQ